MGKVSIQGNARRGTNPRLVQIMERAAASSPYDVVIFSGARPGGRRGSQHHGNSAIDMVLIDPRTGQELPNYKTASTYPQYETFARAARQAQQELYPELSNQFRWGGWFDQGGPDLMHFDLGSGGMRLGGWESGLNSYGQQVYARQGPGFVYSHTQRSAAPTTRYANLWGREDFSVPAESGTSPDLVRMAQEYLNENGIQVPVSGQMDEATAAGIAAFRSSAPGMAFAQRFGLQRPSQAPQMGFAPERQQTPAQAAINDAMLDARPDRSQPGAYRVDAQPYRGAAPGADPSTLMQPMAGRPPPVMQIAQAQPPTLPAFQPRKPGEIDPGRFEDAFGTPSARPPGQPDPARFDDAFGTRPPTTAPMMAVPDGSGVPLAPASPYQANFTDKATGLPPQPLTWPGGVDYMRQPPVRSVNELLAALPPSLSTVLPPPDTELDTVVIPPPGGAPALPRPNPLLPSQRGRSGRTPNGYQWQQIPQKGGPTLLRVTPPNNRRPWTEVLGPAGGAGLFNEFASSFTPVRYR